MFSNKLRTAVVALATAGALAVPASALATNPVVWRTSQGSSLAAQPTDTGNYTLANWNRVVRTYSTFARVSAIRSPDGESVSSTYQPL